MIDSSFQVDDVLSLAEEPDRRQGNERHSLRTARVCPPDTDLLETPQFCLSVTLRDLIEREGEGL